MLCLAVAPRMDAAEAALVAYGACRDGVPNGAYELRMPDGRLRAIGAFHGGKRTGTFIFWNAAGGRLAAIPYDEDVRNGTIALWHLGGTPPREIARKLEAPVADGRAHGTSRAWHASGRLRFEAEYERDRLVSATAWDAAGRALSASEARRIAQEDRKGEEAYLAGLERLIAEHPPACEQAGGQTMGQVDDKGARREP